MSLHHSGSLLALAAGLLFVAPCGMISADEEAKAAAPANATPAKRSERGPKREPGKPGGPSGETPPDGAAKSEGEKSGDDKAKTPDEPKVVQRPDKPTEPADPQELAVRPDADGKLQLNFTGQPWEDVLVWLAGISGQSLDWQELPGDYLNLRTRERYTIPEVRDLINRHLLARGFTLLRNGEVLSVVNLKKLDPSLVPSVPPEELGGRDPHEFVRVTFPLNWLLAEKAVEEFKPLLSPNGQLAKLGATNRLQATDAVVNLRAIDRVLREEQSGQGQERLVREFRLEHARAAEVKEQLDEFLGIEKKDAGPMTPQQMQMMQQRMQMMQQQGQRPGGPNAGDKKDDIALIANLRENSIIAQAPPDRMAVIEQTVKMLDVPRESDQALLRNMSRMQVYRTAQLDPEALVKILTDVGDLDPQTRLEVDKKHHSVIAYASLADHLTIRMVIEKLDGSDRKFEVIRLRRLEADFVAGTIRFMMGGEEDENQSRRSPYRYYYFGSYGSDEEESKTGKFRVDADVENNRLLLWANEIELAEIENLLVKLGEMPSKDASPSTLRVLDLSDEQSEELLKRLRQTWPHVGPNPLIVTPPATEPPPAQPRETPPLLKNTDAALSPDDSGEFASRFVLAQFRRPADTPAEPAVPRTETPPAAADERAASPIHITRGPDGNLILSSPDTRALTALEDLAAELMPPRRDWHVFQLKHRTTWAWGVASNLEDFFKTDETKSGSDYNPFWGFYESSQKESSPTRLSKRRPLKFIPDSDSQTILVQGADDEQLKVIQELIDLYDKPESQESASVRMTKIFYLKHSKAKPLAMAVKDVYRDLLSTNDPALQQNRPQNGKQEPQPERSYTYIFGDQGDGKEPPEPPIKFKGLLSIGVDEQSNALIVSAPNNLLAEVGELIDSLDQAAVASSVTTVVPVDISVDSAEVRRRLEHILGIGSRTLPPATTPTSDAPPARGVSRRFTTSRTGDRRGADTIGQATPAP